MFTKVKRKKFLSLLHVQKALVIFVTEYSKPSKALIAIAHNLAPNKERRRKGNVSVL